MPDPNTRYPIILPNGEIWPHTVFLRNMINHPRIQLGDFTYYNDFDNPEDFAKRLAPYLHPSSPERLVIGKYVQIAHGVQFITSSANHQMDGFSTFPFAVFGGTWSKAYEPKFPFSGDTIIENDIWIGHKALIMPGVSIGNGSIIGAGSVVTKNVLPYTIVAGNPAKVIKKRFCDEIIHSLLEIAWWNWEADKVLRNIRFIVGGDIDALKLAV